MEVPYGDPSLSKVVVILTTDTGHRLLEAGQFGLEVLDRMVEDVQGGRLHPDHLPKLIGLKTGLRFISQIDIQPKTPYLGLLLPKHPPQAVNHVQIGPPLTGGEGTWKPVITCWVHLELMCIFPTM